ncbi:MAG: NUDIX domain-containing protein [Chloroflexi bacterium]|nr:NUDIX domain-containing protein [Chloroflexota bacterium]
MTTSEILDVVNDDDIVTGRETRAVVHQTGLQHRGVHVFLFTADGRMLTQKRSADRAACPSALDCSVSEHVKAGESYLDAAKRGMKEELGLEGVEIEPLVKFKMNYGINDNEISVLYQGAVEPRKVSFDSVEIEDVFYYSPRELRQMADEGRVELCGWFLELLRWREGEPSRLLVMED